MPSPRSVLIDIDTHGLDPSVAHSSITAGGNLRPPTAEAVKEERVTEKKKAVKPGLVKLDEEKEGAADDDLLTLLMQEDEQAPTTDADESAKKAPKKAKKPA